MLKLHFVTQEEVLVLFSSICAGFEVAAEACCGTGLFEMSYLCNRHSLYTCEDANKYVFWDSFHPTERTARVVVDDLMPKLKAYFL